MQPKLNLIPDFSVYLQKANRQRYLRFNFFRRKNPFPSSSWTFIT